VYGGCLGFTERWRTSNGCDKFRLGANQPLTRKCPNGETLLLSAVTYVCRSTPREVKHLSTWRNRKQYMELSFWTTLLTIYSQCHCIQDEGSCDSLSSGERNGNSPNHTCLHVWGCRTESAFSCRELQIV